MTTTPWRLARALLALAGASFVLTGLVFFVLPDYSAANFPWNVSVFVAMTIGGWALGTGGMALHAAWRWELPVVYPSLVYVWVFCLFELIVVIAFVGALRTDHWLTWPYLFSLLTGLASGVAGLPRLLASRAEVRRPGIDVPRWVLFFLVSFIVIVGVLGGLTSLIVASGGRVFPEPLTAFTTRAFSAFFLSLVMAAVALGASRDLRAYIYFATTGMFLVVPITVAALLNLDKFDFLNRPGTAVYLGAYALTAAIATYAALWFRRRHGQSPA